MGRGQGEGAREVEKREEVKQVDQKRKKNQERRTKRPRELVAKILGYAGKRSWGKRSLMLRCWRGLR